MMIRLPVPRPIAARFSAQLDLCRWIAAFLVCTEHLRSLCLVDYDPAIHQASGARLFYALHGYGHEAVMIFFVLSGYLVGGEVLRQLQQGCFAWRHYALRRFARLYAVYLAALLLGGLLDHAGVRLLRDTGLYTHGLDLPMVFYDVSARLAATTLAGNLLFCQTLLVPSFGSNVPLWSLANEAWYYVLFPLLAVPAFLPLRWPKRLLLWAGVVLVAWFIRGPILIYFSVWLIGAWMHFPSRPLLRRAWPALTLVVIMMLLVRLHVLARVPLLLTDLVIGGAFALAVQSLSHGTATNYPLAAWHRRLAGFTYSLYLIHWPVALFVVAACQLGWGLGLRSSFSGTGLLFYLLVLGLVYLCAWLLARQTEGRTASLRRHLAPLFGLKDSIISS